MYRLDRFLVKREPLKYTLPWARVIAGDPTLVLNKDGSLQTVPLSWPGSGLGD